LFLSEPQLIEAVGSPSLEVFLVVVTLRDFDNGCFQSTVISILITSTVIATAIIAATATTVIIAITFGHTNPFAMY
jgi:hypothetical protein